MLVCFKILRLHESLLRRFLKEKCGYLPLKLVESCFETLERIWRSNCKRHYDVLLGIFFDQQQENDSFHASTPSGSSSFGTDLDSPRGSTKSLASLLSTKLSFSLLVACINSLVMAAFSRSLGFRNLSVSSLQRHSQK